MSAPKSKITAQGQISVPADIRKRLGVGPGATLEWVEEDGKIFVKRAGDVTWDDVHKAAFPNGPPKKKIDVKDAIQAYIRQRHARD